MLMFEQHPGFRRFVSFVVLMSFGPVSVDYWNFLPQIVITRAEAEEPTQGASPAMALAKLDADELQRLIGGPGKPEGPAEGRFRVASSSIALPLAETVLASIPTAEGTAASSASQEPQSVEVAQLDALGRELRGPQGPSEAVSQLGKADGLWQDRRYSDALVAYFELIDRYPNTNEALWADQGMWNVLDGLKAGSIDRAAVAGFEEQLGAWPSRTVEGAYQALTYYGERALAEHARKNAAETAGYAAKSSQRALQLLRDYPDHFYAMSAADYYQEAVQMLGGEEEGKAIESLRQFAEGLKPCQARLGAYYALGIQFSRADINARADAENAWSNVIAEARRDYVKGMQENAGLPFWVKGYLGEYFGRAFAEVGEYAQAKSWYDAGLKQCAHVGPTHWYLAFRSAQMSELMNPMNPAEGAAAYQNYLKSYPGSNLADHALLRLGAVYMLAGDYQNAASFYQEVVRRFPDSPAAKTAEDELDFLLRHLYDSGPAYASAAPGASEAVHSAQICGPNALREFLARLGVDSTVQELSTLAGTDESGTTMLGLVKAAEAKGVKLNGVRVDSVDSLDLPAIAYVNHSHFLVVTAVRPDGVAIVDPPQGEQVLTLAEFNARWDGKALVREEPDGELMTVAMLETSKGGSTHPQAPNPNAQPDQEYQGITGGAGIGSNDPEGLGSGALQWTSVNSPGVNLKVNPYETCLDLREKDLTLEVRGPMALSFGRAYINEKGFPRTMINSRMGHWTSNLSIYVKTGALETPEDINSAPLTMTLQDSSGTARLYNWTGEDANYFYYTRATTGQTNEKGIVLRRKISNTSSQRRIYADFPNGLRYEFSHASSPGNGTARLEYIKDADGANTITFQYNSTSQTTGLLTKVQGPSGDLNHLAFSYSSNILTKAELKENTTVLQTVNYEYEYNGGFRLTKVTDNAGKTVKYAYTDAGGVSNFITKITDKNNVDTNLSWYFIDDANGDWGAYKIEINDAGGLKQVFERSVSTNINVVTPKDGTTDLSKSTLTPLTGDASRSRYEDQYLDGTTYDRWSYEYDGGKDMTRQLKPGDIVSSTVSYTSTGRIVSTADNSGATATFAYPAGGLNPTKLTDETGLDTTYEYTVAGRATKVVTPVSGSTGFQVAYDTLGQVTSASGPLGTLGSLVYDTKGQVVTKQDALGNAQRVEYDAHGNVTRSIDPRGKSTYYYYTYGGCGGCGGNAGLLTKVKDPLNHETVFAYDANGNRTKVTNALNVATDYFYDTMNRLTKVQTPSGTGPYMTYAYDKQGKMTAETDFNGKTVTYAYDFQGRLTQKSDAVGTLEYMTYDSAGNLSTVTDGLSHTTDYDYDNDGRVIRVTYANGKVALSQYDAAGRVTKTGAGSAGTIDPTEQFYDAATGLLTKTRYTTGTTTHDAFYAYDTLGRVTCLTDWLDGTNGLRYAYDSAGRLTQLTDYDNATLTYAYDAAGNVLSMTDYHGATTSYTYTDTGQLSTLTAPGSRTWTYTYNNLGQPYMVGHPNGMSTFYDYDARNRMTVITHSRGFLDVALALVYGLDAGGNITHIDEYQQGVNITAKWDYGYDGRNRLTNAVRKDGDESIAASYAYTYDAGDNLLSKTEPFLDDFEDGNYTGWGVSSGWSAAGGVMTETASAWAGFSRTNTDKDFDLRFRYSTADSGSGFTGGVRLRYVDGSNLLYLSLQTTGLYLMKVEGGTYTTLASNTSATSAASAWYDVRVLCDGTNCTVWRGTAGGGMEQVLNITNAPFTSTSQLYFWSASNASYSFDDIEVVGSSLANTGTSFGYNAGNELTSQTAGGVSTSLSYDAWGRMTGKTRGSYSATYAWGQGDKLTGVTSTFPGEGSVTYAYGGDGKRRERNDGTVTKYRWDSGWNVLEEEDGSGTLTSTLVGRLADIAGTSPSTGTIRYHLRDHLGSLRALYDPSKTLLGANEYTPYGEDYLQSGATATRKFTGHDWDSDAGAYYAPYRYMSPVQGHWFSRDPLGSVAGPNVYSYVGGSPINASDPLGLLPCLDSWCTTYENALQDLAMDIAKSHMRGHSTLYEGSEAEIAASIENVYFVLNLRNGFAKDEQIAISSGAFSSIMGRLKKTLSSDERKLKDARRKVEILEAREREASRAGLVGEDLRLYADKLRRAKDAVIEMELRVSESKIAKGTFLRRMIPSKLKPGCSVPPDASSAIVVDDFAAAALPGLLGLMLLGCWFLLRFRRKHQIRRSKREQSDEWSV